MADDVDIVMERMDRDFSRLKTHNFDIESSTHCRECGEEIPERRRNVGNIHHCVGCQTVIESDNKHRFQR